MNIANQFLKTAQSNSSRSAVIYGDAVTPYAELMQKITKFACGLKDLGLHEGDRVALMMNNRQEFVVAYYATLMLGAAIVPINTFLLEDELRFQLNDVEPKIFIGNDWVVMRFEGIQKDVKSVHHAIFTLPETTLKPKWFLSFDAVLDSGDGPLEAADVRDDDVAVIKYTSGTTGKPKGAMQTHGNVEKFISACIEAYEISSDECSLLFVPLFHGFGDHCCMNVAFRVGASFVLMDPFDPNAIFSAIEKHRCTYFGATPSMLYGLITHQDAEKYEVSSLKRVLTGGGPVTREIVEGFQKKFNVPVLQGYGLTEGCAGYAFTRPDMPYKDGSCGTPLPGVRIKVVDERGHELPAGEPGEIVAQSEFNMKGYWKNEKATAEVLKNGWLHTGDIGTMDEEGNLYIVDRKKDMIIMSGENIYPAEIENVLASHPCVGEVAVIGVPDARRGEIPCAVIVKKPGTEVTENEIISFCKERLAAFKVPKIVKFTGSLPKNMSFKVLRRELREKFFPASRETA